MAVLLGIMRSNALMRDEACTCWKGAERNPQSHMRAWILFVCSVYALCFFFFAAMSSIIMLAATTTQAETTEMMIGVLPLS